MRQNDSKILEKNLKDNFESICHANIPYIGYSYSLYLFTERLYNICIEKNIRHLFFLSREGEFLKRLFDYYLELKNDTSIITFYFYTSRISSFVASLRPLDEERFERLFRSYPDMSLEKFLVNCGFSEEKINVLNQYINIDFKQIIYNISDSDELAILINEPQFIEFYDEIRNEQRKNFDTYVKSFKVDLQIEGFHIVDVGWKGTIQDNFISFFGQNILVYGYYWGLDGEKLCDNSQYKQGIMFSNVNGYSNYFDIYFYDYAFLERLLFAKHGSVLKYRYENNVCVPLTKFYENEKESGRIIAPVQEAIYKNFNRIFLMMEKFDVLGEQMDWLFAEIHYNVVTRYTDREKKLQKYMLKRHIENFGFWCFGDKVKIKFSLKTVILNIKKYDHKSRDFLFTLYSNIMFIIRDKTFLFRIFSLFKQALLKRYIGKQKGVKNV